jgi:putative addiction module component (TIGR02574 family)
MARSLDKVRDDAMRLSVEERGVLADDLWWSFLTDEEREIQNEWIEVAEQRAEELHSGKAKGIPLEEVMSELRAKYSSARRRTSSRS